MPEQPMSLTDIPVDLAGAANELAIEFHLRANAAQQLTRKTTHMQRSVEWAQIAQSLRA